MDEVSRTDSQLWAMLVAGDNDDDEEESEMNQSRAFSIVDSEAAFAAASRRLEAQKVRKESVALPGA